MPDVAELLSELDDLPERPPAVPRPVAEIRLRARRRRHRRRAGLAGALVVVTVVGVVALRSDDDGGGPDVDTGPVATPSDPDAPPTTVDVDGVVRLLEGRGLTLDPADGLADGDRVALTLSTDPGGPVEVTQCAAEVVGGAGRLGPASAGWCGSTFYLRDLTTGPDMGLDVARRLGTANGPVDCAEAPGRCVLVARPMTPPSPTRSTSGGPRTADARTYRYAPLVFRDDLPPPPEPEGRLVGADEPVTDGQVVRIEASGFGRVSDLTISQCVGPAASLASTTEAALTQRCDGVRYTRVRTNDAGGATADVRVFHDIGLTDPTRAGQAPRWATCSLCSLVVRGIGTDRVVLPLALAPTDDPIHPAMQVTPPGPYHVGQQLRVEGSGFQARADVAIGCGEAAPSAEAPTCSYDFSVTDAQGAFVLDGVVLSALELAAGRCADGPGTCRLSWERGTGQVVAEVPLDLSG